MIIGITGWFASGKDTVAEYLVRKGFKSYSLSDIIRDHLRVEGKELTRDNLRQKGNELRDRFAADYLAKKAIEKWEKEGRGNAVIPSVRQMGEVKLLKNILGFELWNIDAPAEIRYERLLARARTEDEKKLTFEGFREKEDQEASRGGNCQQIDQTIAVADRTIDNSGTFEDLYKKVDLIIAKMAEKQE